MSKADWRSPAAYEALRSLDAPGFAWEYLNRNAKFQAELRRLAGQADRDILSAEDQAGFAQRWGVRFRRPSRVEYAPSVLDTGGFALSPGPDGGSRLMAEFGG